MKFFCLNLEVPIALQLKPKKKKQINISQESPYDLPQMYICGTLFDGSRILILSVPAMCLPPFYHQNRYASF